MMNCLQSGDILIICVLKLALQSNRWVIIQLDGHYFVDITGNAPKGASLLLVLYNNAIEKFSECFSILPLSK